MNLRRMSTSMPFGGISIPTNPDTTNPDIFSRHQKDKSERSTSTA
jgi:hypothetical protein